MLPEPGCASCNPCVFSLQTLCAPCNPVWASDRRCVLPATPVCAPDSLCAPRSSVCALYTLVSASTTRVFLPAALVWSLQPVYPLYSPVCFPQSLCAPYASVCARPPGEQLFGFALPFQGPKDGGACGGGKSHQGAWWIFFLLLLSLQSSPAFFFFFCVPTMGMMVGQGSIILPSTFSRPRVRGNKDGPACPLACYGCGRQCVPVLGSSKGGSWRTLSFLTVAQGIVSVMRDKAGAHRWCWGVKLLMMVLLLGGDGDLLAVSGCSGSGW